MRIGIINRKSPPEICGISDHTLLLAKGLEAFGHEAIIVAGRGEGGKNLLLTNDHWDKAGLNRLLDSLKKLSPEHLILQYTPLHYSGRTGRQNFDLLKFWRACGRYWKISLFVHETYFRVWWHPPSWWRGTIQKFLLRRLAAESHFVFTASTPLIEELSQWSLKAKIVHLPIGSNFPFIQIDRVQLRQKNGIAPHKILLTLFGGGSALRDMSEYIDELDVYLKQYQVPICWLLLGGISQNWFKLSLPVISPGQLPPQDISLWLQMADIFLMPHQPGLNAKRGTLMAALQHGLPVVGTRGYMTDPFWGAVRGVNLIQVKNRMQFCDTVRRLCLDENLRRSQGENNKQYYQQNFTWEKIAGSFLNTISSQ